MCTYCNRNNVDYCSQGPFKKRKEKCNNNTTAGPSEIGITTYTFDPYNYYSCIIPEMLPGWWRNLYLNDYFFSVLTWIFHAVVHMSARIRTRDNARRYVILLYIAIRKNTDAKYLLYLRYIKCYSKRTYLCKTIKFIVFLPHMQLFCSFVINYIV